jgi:hypothetical protein
VRGLVRRLAARPLLRFPPLEVFAQLVFQPILSRILHAGAAFVRHRSTCPNLAEAAYRENIVLRQQSVQTPQAGTNRKLEQSGPIWPANALAHEGAMWQEPAACRPFSHRFSWAFLLGLASCCRSSVVEHSLGKGEVDSSILSGSTSCANKSNTLQFGSSPRLSTIGINA